MNPARTILDILFPRSCACCNASVGDEALYLCWDCISRIPVMHPPFCRICGNSFSGEIEADFTCSNCSRTTPFFDAARSATRYTGIIENLIVEFKYKNATWLTTDLAALMIAALRANDLEINISGVTYVPLHPRKQRERSYNQAKLLAKQVSAAIKKPFYEKTLYRVKQTISQTHLTAAQRRVNVKGIFSVRKEHDLKNKNILLIDDVMTTGATLNDCARALKAAGARQVVALTVARG